MANLTSQTLEFDQDSFQIQNLMRLPRVSTPNDQAAVQQSMIQGNRGQPVPVAAPSDPGTDSNLPPTNPSTMDQPPTGSNSRDAENIVPDNEQRPQQASKSSYDLKDEEAFPALPIAAPADRPAASFWSSRAARGHSGKKPVGNAQRPGPGQANPSANRVAGVTEVVNLRADQLEAKFRPSDTSGAGNLIPAIRPIAQRFRCSVEASHNRTSNICSLLFKGRKEDVASAKQQVFLTVLLKTTEIIQIPANLTGFILGPKGRTINQISTVSGTRINLPSAEERRNVEAAMQEAGEDDHDSENVPLMDVTIFGVPSGIAMAKREIERLVGNKMNQSHVAIPLDDVPSILFPMIVGVNNANISAIEKDTECAIRFPSYRPPVAENDDDSSPDIRKSVTEDRVRISGKKDQVPIAVERVKELIRDAENTPAMEFVVAKRMHRFVIGPNGQNIVNLLEKTGCVAEIPPAADPSEKIKIRGPMDKIGEGVAQVTGSVAQINIDEIDLLDYVPSETYLDYLKFITFTKRGEVRKIEQDDDVTVRFPSFKRATNEKGPYELEIIGKNKDEVKASRKKVRAIFDALGKCATAEVEVPSELHQLLRRSKVMKAIKEAAMKDCAVDGASVEIFFPVEGDDLSRVCVHLFVPMTSKVKPPVVQQILNQAQEAVMAESKEASDFTSETITIDVKYHKQLKPILNSIIQECRSPDSQTNLSISLGSTINSRDSLNTTSRPQVPDDAVVIRGNKQDVFRAMSKIKKTAEEIKHMTIMSSFETEFSVPAKYLPRIIGKGGAEITKLRNEVPGIVRIDMGDEKSAESRKGPREGDVQISLQGTKKAVDQVKASILAKCAQWDDTIERSIAVPSTYTRRLIGAQGRNLKALEEKYAVRISTSGRRQRDGNGSSGDESPARPQANGTPGSDKVEVRGPKKGVNSAIEELKDLLQYETDHSHVAKASIPANSLAMLIGKKGARILEIQNITQTRIIVPKGEDTTDDSQMLDVTIEGTEIDIRKARAMILHLVGTQASRPGAGVKYSEQVRVPLALHRAIIGDKGAKITEMQAEINRQLSTKYNASKPKREPVNYFEGLDTKETAAVKAATATVLGAGVGANGPVDKEKQGPAAEFFVSIQFPPSRRDDPTFDEMVSIRGKTQEAVDMAKARLLAEVQKLSSSPVRYFKVPSSQRQAMLGRDGSRLKAIEKKYNVSVQLHDSVQALQKAIGESQPVLGDLLEEFAARYRLDKSQVKLDIPPHAKGQGGDMVLAIIGDKEGSEAARRDFVGLLRIQKTHPFPVRVRQEVAGPRMSNISKMRKKYDVIVETPAPRVDDDTKKNLDADEVWTFKGCVDNLEAAIDELDALANEALDQTACWRAVSVPSKLHRLIIGRSGGRLKDIRAETGCQVVVPPSGSGQDEVIVNGPTDEATLDAENMILDILEGQR